MRALVTGGTGFLGRRLVRELLDRGLEVRCFVRPGSDVEPVLAGLPDQAAARLEFVRGSLQRADQCAAAVHGCDLVYHVAAEMSGPTAVLFLGNVVGTRRLVEACAREPVRRFVLVSSLAVYGTGGLRKHALVDEDCPVDAEPHRRDGYTYSKIAQEAVAWEAHRAGRLPLTVVRPGVIYGPGRDALSGRMGIRLGRLFVQMGRQRLPYTFVDNCARAVAAAGLAEAAAGRAYNVVDDDPPTTGQVYKLHRRRVGAITRVKVPRWGVGVLSAFSEWYHRWSRGQLPAVLTRYKSRSLWKPLRYSNDRAKVDLGWGPAVDFTAGLGRTYAWLREQRRP